MDTPPTEQKSNPKSASHGASDKTGGSDNGDRKSPPLSHVLIPALISVVSAGVAGFFALRSDLTKSEADLRSQLIQAAVTTGTKQRELEASLISKQSELKASLQEQSKQIESAEKMSALTTQTQLILAQSQSKTQLDMQDRQARTTRHIANLEAALKKSAQDDEKRLKQSQVFKEVMALLEDTDQRKSTLALLSLWNLYKDERRILVVAAISVKNQGAIKALLQLNPKEVRTYLQDVLKTQDPELMGQAIEVLRNLQAPSISSFITKLDVDNVDDPANPDVRTLVTIVIERPEVRQELVDALETHPNQEEC